MPDNTFNYMMLSRLKADCEYFLNWGKRRKSILRSNSISEHIKEMKRIWISFADHQKPEWLSLEQINDYEKRMTEAVKIWEKFDDNQPPSDYNMQMIEDYERKWKEKNN